MAPWPAGYLDQGCDVEPGPNHVVALVCVCCWLYDRAHADFPCNGPGLRGPGRIFCGEPDFAERYKLLEACCSTTYRSVSRQIPTIIIPSSRIVAVAPTYLIALTGPSSANHGHLIFETESWPLNCIHVSELRRIAAVLGVRITYVVLPPDPFLRP